MSKPISIEFAADTRDVVKGAGNIADAFDEVADSLKDLARDSGRSSDQVADGAKDVTKALDGTGDKAQDMDRRIDQAFSSVTANARKASKAVGEDLDKGFKEASEGSETFKENAGANAKEVAASFDGSAESISDGFQGLAAEMLEGFGPAGLAAGVAMAAGIGIASMAMQDTATKATEAKQKAVDMVDAIAEAGGDLSQMDLADKIKSWGREVLEDNWITFWADESSTKFQETAKDAKDAMVNVRDAIRAGSGSLEDSQKFLDGTADKWQELTRRIEAGTRTTEDGLQVQDDSAKAALKQRNALSDLRGQAEENIKTTENALDIYNLENDALDKTAEAAEKAADAVKDKADANRDAADAAMGAQDADLNWIETAKQMSEDIKANGKTIDINTQAGRDNRRSLLDMADAANAVIEAQVAQGGSTAEVTARSQELRDAFVNQAVAAGYGREEAEKLAASYGLIPGNVDTLVQAHGTEEAKAAVESIPEAKDTTVKVEASGIEQAQTGIGDIKGTEVKAEVKEKGAAEVQAQIDAIHGRDIPITVSITNLPFIESKLANLTAPRSVWVTVNERPGVQAP